MVTQSEKNIFEECLFKWGKPSQILMTLEELNELGLVLCHSLRKIKKVTKKEIIEEITDVKLMIDQMQYIFEITDDELFNMRLAKLSRLRRLLET